MLCCAMHQVLNDYQSMDDFAKIRMLGYESVSGAGPCWSCRYVLAFLL